MEKLRVLPLLLVVFFAGPVCALQLKYFGEASIQTGTLFKKTEIGGLSALVWSKNAVMALSDDKGRNGEPRFYEFSLSLEKNQVSLTPKAVHFLSKVPKSGNQLGLDPEGMALLSSGNFVISSEGDNNAKPRKMPRLFQIQAHGAWQSEIALPAHYLPETTGQQKKGVQNNLSLEGLSSFGKSFFTATEAPLFQDESSGPWSRILKFESYDDGSYKPTKEFAYRISDSVNNEHGPQVFNGVSEVLALSETKLLVLERGVRILKGFWANTVSLYLVDLGGATNILAMESLVGMKFVGAEKTKLLDFETDLTSQRSGKRVQNFEGLSWGPNLPDGRRTLLVLSDNNFSKREITELLVFSVDGE